MKNASPAGSPPVLQVCRRGSLRWPIGVARDSFFRLRGGCALDCGSELLNVLKFTVKEIFCSFGCLEKKRGSFVRREKKSGQTDSCASECGRLCFSVGVTK